jgi:hypothetical protein
MGKAGQGDVAMCLVRKLIPESILQDAAATDSALKCRYANTPAPDRDSV